MSKSSLRSFIKNAKNTTPTGFESNETFASQVGGRLKYARKCFQSITGETLKDIAKKLEIDQSTICHYEAGRRTPSLLHFKKMCDEYRADPIVILNTKHKSGTTIHKFVETDESISPDDSANISEEEGYLLT